jgi:flagellar biosynthesis protein FlhF
MQIKRFEAKTMTAALKMVKDEFGVNAVILSARSLRDHRGFLGMGRSSGVEVTAANDSAGTGSAGVGPALSDRWATNGPLNGDARSVRRGLFQSLNDGLRSLTHRRAGSAGAAAPLGPAAELTPVYHHLLSQEVERGLAGDLIEQIQRLPGFDPRLDGGDLRPYALRVLHDMGVRKALDAAAASTPRVCVLIGPGGAGKTTTAVKRAVANARRAQGNHGALLTLDDHRIGAIEQLRIFGSILGIPVAIATSAAGVQATWQSFQAMDWVIVDTPGVSLGETQRRSELRQLLEPLKQKEVHLVLNAGTREKDLMRMIEAWRGFPVDRLMFTRLDEAGTCGHLLNLLAQTGLPLSELGTGPRIPEDLAEQPLDTLLGRIWPASTAGGAGTLSSEPRAADDGQRVANGSSELYHRSDCKWVRKIKPGHLIHFASSAEAEARQFVACRNCHPQQDTRPDSAAWTARQAAGER